MLIPLDVECDQKYQFNENGERFIAKLVKLKSNGDLVFDRLDGEGKVYSDRASFILKRGRGDIARLNEVEVHGAIPSIEPAVFEPISETDRPVVKRRKKKFLKFATQQYYVMLMDELGTPRSVLPIRKLIAEKTDEHDALGLSEKRPGASTLIRLWRECGEVGYRPLHLFLDNNGGDQTSGGWHKYILRLKRVMLYWYWSPRKPTPSRVKKWFDAAAVTGMERLGESFDRPTRQTLQNWLDEAGTLENRCRRDGRALANMQIEGVHAHVQALRPLECVVLDHTRADMHVVLREFIDGKVVETFIRPWLIIVIDVHTRMILAANLTVEDPSIYTLMAGLQQSLTPKDFLSHLVASSAYGWAVDGWGKFKRMLVDNGLENIGKSLQTYARVVGLSVSFAPVKTPQYKAIGERFFQTANTMFWHEADGGVRFKRGQSDEDPRTNAVWTLAEAQEKFWEWIVTVYHLKVTDGLDMAPAHKWRDSFKKYMRPMIDDMNLINNVFGKAERRQVTTSGVRYNNTTYYNKQAVDQLLSDGRARNTRGRSPSQQRNSIGVDYEFVFRRWQPSVISIYNPYRQSYLQLQDVNNKHNLTQAQLNDAKFILDKAKEEFIPANEVIKNEARLLASITKSPTPDPLAEEWDEVLETDGIVSSGEADGSHNSPHIAAVYKTDRPVSARKGVRRGGDAATRKSTKTRKANKAAAAAIKHAETQAAIDAEIDASAQNLKAVNANAAFKIEDKAAYYDRIRANLNLPGSAK